MHKVAVLTSHQIILEEGDDYDRGYATVKLIDGITEWADVNDADFELLQKYCKGHNGKRYNYVLLEQVTSKIPKLISEFKQIAIAEEQEHRLLRAKMEAEALARKAKAAEREQKKLAKNEEARKKLYNELKSQFEGTHDTGTTVA
jgi:hypothetical protein